MSRWGGSWKQTEDPRDQKNVPRFWKTAAGPASALVASAAHHSSPSAEMLSLGERKSHSVMEVEEVNETSFAEMCLMASVAHICGLMRSANGSVLKARLFPQPSTSECCQLGCNEGFVTNVP